MNKTPTLEEAQRDLAQTDRDIEYLTAITTNLRAFIQNDEGRNHYKMELYKHEHHLRTGKELREKILKVIDSYDH